MLQKITGSCFKSMINYGVNNLEKHCDIVNDLNVFPVPDGDTGTNMVMTSKSGLPALDMDSDDLSVVAKGFANGTVFGARGNSGVILSQFFKGLAEGFDSKDADVAQLAQALNKGCQYAYTAVAKPVEGTILTVIKDGCAKVDSDLVNISSIDETVSVFLKEAKISLDNTPNLLPILKKAGVIDSGGAGLVYFFEGIQRFLSGEPLDTVQSAEVSTQYVDYTAFNRDTNFEYGYCTETLLQLTVAEDEFDYDAFSRDLQSLGESIVTSLEQDKVKLHIHTHTPEKVLAFCHQFGEFLSLKIENMSVQHTQTIQKYLYAPNQEESTFALVAVAPNSLLQNMFSEMGADVVILSKDAPSSQDFIEAFELVDTQNILVFPNSSNSILSALQAGNLYEKAKVAVLNCKSVAECYSAMAVIDFGDPDIDAEIDTINETISNVYQVSVTRATKTVQFGSQTIVKGDYLALADQEVIATDGDIDKVALSTVDTVLQSRESSVINLFYGQNITEEHAQNLAETIQENFDDVEVCLISTQSTIYDIILSFE